MAPIFSFLQLLNSFKYHSNEIHPSQNKLYMLSFICETLNIFRTIETFPPTFEELDQEHGFVFYQHKIASYNRDPSLLDLTDSVRDRAMVYVNKQRAATLTRAEIETSPIGGGLRPGIERQSSEKCFKNEPQQMKKKQHSSRCFDRGVLA